MPDKVNGSMSSELKFYFRNFEKFKSIVATSIERYATSQEKASSNILCQKKDTRCHGVASRINPVQPFSMILDSRQIPSKNFLAKKLYSGSRAYQVMRHYNETTTLYRVKPEGRGRPKVVNAAKLKKAIGPIIIERVKRGRLDASRHMDKTIQRVVQRAHGQEVPSQDTVEQNQSISENDDSINST